MSGLGDPARPATRPGAGEAPASSRGRLHAGRAGDESEPYTGARLVPVTRNQTRAFVNAHHRHSEGPVGDIFRVGLEVDGVLVGVMIAGRPVARRLDDGRTIEVMRVCLVDGVESGCSRLYGAACRAAKALGYTRVVTYTLEDELGTSVRAAGFVECEPHNGGERSSWVNNGRARYTDNLFGERKRDTGPKRRWQRLLG